MSEGDAHGGHSTSLRDYLRVVRRRKWIILQAVILVPAVAVGLSLRQEKVYKATSQVLLVQQNPADQFNGINQSSVSTGRPAGADAGRSRAGAASRSDGRSSLAGVRRTVDQFLKHSSAAAKTNSDLLELSAWDHDPRCGHGSREVLCKSLCPLSSRLDTAPYVAREGAARMSSCARWPPRAVRQPTPTRNCSPSATSSISTSRF